MPKSWLINATISTVMVTQLRKRNDIIRVQTQFMKLQDNRFLKKKKKVLSRVSVVHEYDGLWDYEGRPNLGPE
jgi:hypothetical protein